LRRGRDHGWKVCWMSCDPSFRCAMPAVIDCVARPLWVGSQAQWTQTIFKRSFKFQNPLRQNYKHVKALEAVLDVPPETIHSVVVFAGGSTFKTPMPANVTRVGGYTSYIKSFSAPVLDEWHVQLALSRIQTRRLAPTRECLQGQLLAVGFRARGGFPALLSGGHSGRGRDRQPAPTHRAASYEDQPARPGRRCVEVECLGSTARSNHGKAASRRRGGAVTALPLSRGQAVGPLHRGFIGCDVSSAHRRMIACGTGTLSIQCCEVPNTV
jgi:Nuclease-related domain